MTRKRITDKQLCYCGYVYDGRRCKALQKEHPLLGKPGWHNPVGEYAIRRGGAK